MDEEDISPDLTDYIKNAEIQREKGGRLERRPRDLSVKHRCTPPTAKTIVDLKVGDLWHCDCGRTYEYVLKEGPKRAIHTEAALYLGEAPGPKVPAWEERIRWQRGVLYAIFCTFPLVAFVAMLGPDTWYHDLGWFIATVLVMVSTRWIAHKYYTRKEIE